MKHFKILSVLAAVCALTIGSVAAYAQTSDAAGTTQAPKAKKAHKKAAKHHVKKTTSAPATTPAGQ